MHYYKQSVNKDFYAYVNYKNISLMKLLYHSNLKGILKHIKKY